MTVKADWKRYNYIWRLKVDSLSTERMCTGREFQVDEKVKARYEKSLVISDGRAGRFGLVYSYRVGR